MSIGTVFRIFAGFTICGVAVGSVASILSTALGGSASAGGFSGNTFYFASHGNTILCTERQWYFSFYCELLSIATITIASITLLASGLFFHLVRASAVKEHESTRSCRRKRLQCIERIQHIGVYFGLFVVFASCFRNPEQFWMALIAGSFVLAANGVMRLQSSGLTRSGFALQACSIIPLFHCLVSLKEMGEAFGVYNHEGFVTQQLLGLVSALSSNVVHLFGYLFLLVLLEVSLWRESCLRTRTTVVSKNSDDPNKR